MGEMRISILVFFLGLCSADFSSDRAALLASEAAMALGGDVVLDSLEEAANEKIMEAKEEELQVRRKGNF